MTGIEDVFDPTSSPSVELVTEPAGIPEGKAIRRMQDSRGFATAIQVQAPRDLARVETNVKYEAAKLAERAFYGWGAGKDTIEGPSIKCANMLGRCWGNCAVDTLPVQELDDAWVFTAAFIDLESGFTLTRQFRQSKNWTVYGKHDAERKDDIRFQIGQSKATRNVLLNALPDWLVASAMAQAKAGVRAAITASIDKGGLDSAQKLALQWLKKYGVTEERVLAKFGRSAPGGLTIDDLITIRTDLVAIGDGVESPGALYPGDEPKSKAELRDSLTKPAEPAAAPEASESTPEPVESPSEPETSQDRASEAVNVDAMRDTIRSRFACLTQVEQAKFWQFNPDLKSIDDVELLGASALKAVMQTAVMM